MQRLHLDVFVPVVVREHYGVGIEMFTTAVVCTGMARCGRMRKIRLMAMTMLVVGVRSCPSRLRVFVLLSTDVSMCVRACHPDRQQGDADQQGDSRSGLAETVQHLRQRSRRDCLERSRRTLAAISYPALQAPLSDAASPLLATEGLSHTS